MADGQQAGGFDKAAHRVVAPRPFSELVLGERFVLPSRTITEANFAAFQAVSGDNHPIHYDVEYCRAQGHPGLLAHGLQVLCFTASGAGLFPHVLGEALLGFIEQSSKFHKPVHAGDTLYPALTIAELKPQRTTGIVTVTSTVHNQRGELVLSGEQKYLMRMGGP
ncbi:dehydratase [Rhodopseudomonas palustris]|uniref:Dehydratase n=1 Tax=Rhodopseudomonas palustris TaxID=1076 RepID=A0A323V046_RHOPL|nr:MaoC family dehydratase [Rhodopseudomonas palustris]PZA13538.1 dehydratase [Rhodopseudomonas palustris]